MKKKMVTRTVCTTICDVLCVHVSDATVTNEKFILTGMFDTKESALKQCVKLYKTDDCIPSAIINLSFNENLYGMSESAFIANAVILPPRTVYEKE